MQIGTAVFERIVLEAKQEGKTKAIKVLVDVMGQTARFGTYTEEYRRECAEYFLKQE